MVSRVKTFAVVSLLLSMGLAYGCSSDDGATDGAGGEDSGGSSGKGGTPSIGGKATSAGTTAKSGGAGGAGTAGKANLGGGAGKASGGSSSGGVTTTGGAATGGKSAAGATSTGGVQQAGAGGTALAGNAGRSSSAGTTSSSGGAAGSNAGGAAGSNGGTTTTAAGTAGRVGAGGAGGTPPATGGTPPATGGTPPATGGAAGTPGAAGAAGTAARSLNSLVLQYRGIPCWSCAVANCSTIDSTVGADVVTSNPGASSCETMTGIAAAGPAIGQSRQELCYNNLECLLQSNCASIAVNSVQPCYCGSASDCLGGIGVNGTCKATIEAALESVSSSYIANNFGILALPGGRSNQLIQCLMDAIQYGVDPTGCNTCFPGQ